MQLAGSRTARGVHRSFAVNNAAQDDTESAGKVKMYAIGEGGCGLCLPAAREIRHTPGASTLVHGSAFSRPPRFFLTSRPQKSECPYRCAGLVPAAGKTPE
jgi:hypothetical protein